MVHFSGLRLTIQRASLHLPCALSFPIRNSETTESCFCLIVPFSDPELLTKYPTLQDTKSLLALPPEHCKRGPLSHPLQSIPIPSHPIPTQLNTLDTTRTPTIIRLIRQRAISVRITPLVTPPRAGDILLGPILGAAATGGDAKVTRQVAGLEDDARAAALRLTLVARPEGAGGVLGVAEFEGHLGGAAVPRAFAEAVVFEAAAGGAQAGEVVAEGRAGAGGVFRLVGESAFDADGLEGFDGAGGAGFRVAGW